jgi:hypothetical protein
MSHTALVPTVPSFDLSDYLTWSPYKCGNSPQCQDLDSVLLTAEWNVKENAEKELNFENMSLQLRPLSQINYEVIYRFIF